MASEDKSTRLVNTVFDFCVVVEKSIRDGQDAYMRPRLS